MRISCRLVDTAMAADRVVVQTKDGRIAVYQVGVQHTGSCPVCGRQGEVTGGNAAAGCYSSLCPINDLARAGQIVRWGAGSQETGDRVCLMTEAPEDPLVIHEFWARQAEAGPEALRIARQTLVWETGARKWGE
jgi:hypothetical protein